jgi:CheY-like chemotaxis protein
MAAAPGPRVLVADDDPAMVEVVREALEECLRDVAPAIVAVASAEEAAAPGAGRFALVLTDSFYRPGRDRPEDRWAAVDRVVAAAGATPVVLSTAHAEAAFADYAAHGVAALVPRPFDLAALCALVRRLLGLPASPA